MASRNLGGAQVLLFVPVLRMHPAISGEAFGPLLPPPATPAPVNGG